MRLGILGFAVLAANMQSSVAAEVQLPLKIDFEDALMPPEQECVSGTYYLDLLGVDFTSEGNPSPICQLHGADSKDLPYYGQPLASTGNGKSSLISLDTAVIRFQAPKISGVKKVRFSLTALVYEGQGNYRQVDSIIEKSEDDGTNGESLIVKAANHSIVEISASADRSLSEIYISGVDSAQFSNPVIFVIDDILIEGQPKETPVDPSAPHHKEGGKNGGKEGCKDGAKHRKKHLPKHGSKRWLWMFLKHHRSSQARD